MNNTVCLILNGLLTGFICAIVGTLGIFLSKKNNIDIKYIKVILITFALGFVVHIILDLINFNDLYCDKKCGNILSLF